MNPLLGGGGGGGGGGAKHNGYAMESFDNHSKDHELPLIWPPLGDQLKSEGEFAYLGVATSWLATSRLHATRNVQ